MAKLVVLLFGLLVLTAAFTAKQAYAQEYYADVTFDVDDAGAVSIKGLTNHPLLSERTAQEFTSKKGRYWVLNITINDTFSDFAYTVNLPKSTAINYAKSPAFVRIGAEEERPFVKGTGKNSRLQIILQYSIESNQDQNSQKVLDRIAQIDLVPYILFAFILAIMFAGFAFYNKRKALHAKIVGRQSGKKRKVSKKQGIKPETWYNKTTLTDRQRQIVEILENFRKPITQKLLEKEMGIPKSSLSRNLESLVKRGIINKESKGMTNVIFLNPKKPEI